MKLHCIRLAIVSLLLAAPISICAQTTLAAEPFRLAEDDGYRGIWYMNQPTKDEYAYKYSGGMATYPQQHLPIAIYAPEVKKTFFVYGGSPAGERRVLEMVSYFDHPTKTFPRPRILLDKKTSDAHENPTLSIDAAGHLWIFSNGHGAARPAFIHRSTKPYSIDEFELVADQNFSYSQPWYLPESGFFFLHTRYHQGERRLFWMTSADGLDWSKPAPLAQIAKGHYQASWTDGRRVATAFDYHPNPGGLNARTNLYYLETSDQGKTWTNAAGEAVQVPLTEIKNPALVRDYLAEKQLVYLKQLHFDGDGRPVILYETSGGYAPGPKNDPRVWRLTRWTGKRWETNDVTRSDHNYDYGSLYLEADGAWRLIAPTEPGAQPFGTGGDMVMWTSRDQGHTWQKQKQLTRDTERNHSFAQQPRGAQPDFYALWADGNARRPSESSLYFTDREGTHVWRMPTKMTEATAKGEVAW